MNDGRRALIRCDGTPELGMGHVVRCLALADELRDVHAVEVEFLVKEQSVGSDRIAGCGYRIDCQPERLPEADWIGSQIYARRPDILILDTRTGLARQAVAAWRRSGVLIVSIDDPEDKRLEADLLFCPPVPQVFRMNWDGFAGEKSVGWDWVILRKQFATQQIVAADEPVPASDRPLSILVAMGGSDSAGLTLLALKALDQIDRPVKVTVLLGSGFGHEQALSAWQEAARKEYGIIRNVEDVASVMARADLAIASFGVTAYELAAMGVPALYFCLTADHADSARLFTDAGIGVSLGIAAEITVEKIVSTLERLIDDPAVRRKMSLQAAKVIDGQGAARVAQKIVSIGMQK